MYDICVLGGCVRRKIAVFDLQKYGTPKERIKYLTQLSKAKANVPQESVINMYTKKPEVYIAQDKLYIYIPGVPRKTIHCSISCNVNLQKLFQ